MRNRAITQQTRFDIVHIPVQDIDTVSTPAAATYFICWLRQIPVGHYWFVPGQVKSDAYLHEELKKSTASAVDYYTKHHQTPQQTKKDAVSIIVCTRNRAHHLKHCLDNLLATATPEDEIIIVDNAPTDDSTKNLVSQYPNVVYILESKPGLDRARNAGAKYARHQLLAYTDDDVKVPANWVQTIRQAFDDPLTMAVTGNVLPDQLETTSQIIFEYDWGFNKGYLPVTYDHAYFRLHAEHSPPVWNIGAGATMAFRKRVFELVGWFDERLDVGASGCSGDSEFWFRILAEGWNCVYQPHWFVFHVHRDTLEGLKSQLFYYMKGHTSALMVQEQRYPGTGNLRRLKRDMPMYYWKRFYQGLLFKWARDNRYLMQEIKGCIAGVKYFKVYKNHQTNYIRCLPILPELQHRDASAYTVTVIITCYNQGKFLAAAIESVLRQSHVNVSILVVNDGSTDETAQVCETFSDQVTYLYTERVGVSAARNIGAAHSKCDFVLFLDGDDYLLEHALEINLYFFMQRPEVALVSGAHDRLENDRLVETQSFDKQGYCYVDLLQGNFIAMQGTVLYRRVLFDHFHFDTRRSVVEDYAFNLEICRNFKIFTHSRKIAVYRIHENNVSRKRHIMLEQVVGLLQTQRSLGNTPEERKAIDDGINTWTNFYS